MNMDVTGSYEKLLTNQENTQSKVSKPDSSISYKRLEGDDNNDLDVSNLTAHVSSKPRMVSGAIDGLDHSAKTVDVRQGRMTSAMAKLKSANLAEARANLRTGSHQKTKLRTGSYQKTISRETIMLEKRSSEVQQLYYLNKKRHTFNTMVMQKMMFQEQEIELDDYRFQYKIDLVQAEIEQ